MRVSVKFVRFCQSDHRERQRRSSFPPISRFVPFSTNTAPGLKRFLVFSILSEDGRSWHIAEVGRKSNEKISLILFILLRLLLGTSIGNKIGRKGDQSSEEISGQYDASSSSLSLSNHLARTLSSAILSWTSNITDESWE
ncbi:hypothetical protein WN55_10183 [Dufourea novaeangliae]|uniref:Uncharacterized protein n=1 Tax=Dufourea novaeangliae TaxID=178035 RepID=A0A154P4N2_DUFNO|nr:hypothetical protein WN55_10183 [Dufourea novaeangliae]